MFQEEQIKELLAEKIEIYKNCESKKKGLEFNEIYTKSVDYYERIRPHSEIGIYPEKLLSNRAPNQTQEEADYIKATFKNITVPIWTKFMGSIAGIWNPQNWSIKWNQENNPVSTASETPQKYLDEEYPSFNSLESYFKTVVTPMKERDANGVLAHKPYEIPVKLNDNNEFEIVTTERINPIAVIYNSGQIWSYKDKEHLLVLLKEKSLVEYGNRKEQSGLVFEFYDRDNIWKIVQVGKKNDYKFELYLYWPHNLGYLPCDKLKGEPIVTEDGILYQSRFMGAVEIMDDILLDDTYLRIIKAGHAFPHKWEYFDECEYSTPEGNRCITGKVMYDRGDGLKEHNCPNCHGTGKSKASSPNGVFQVKAPNQMDSSSKDFNIPPFGWVSPDPTIMEFLRAEMDSNKEKAYELLNLVSTSNVKGSETALGKMVDRQEKESFVQPIISETFDLYGFSIKCHNDMRYGVDQVEKPSLNYPKTSSIMTPADITAEIAEAKANGLPDIALRNLLLEYLNTRFQSDERVNKSVDLTFYIDRLVSLSNTEVIQKKNSGGAANWEDILHTSIYTFIAEATNQDQKFFEKPIEQQGQILIDMAKAKDAEINPKKLNPDQIITNGI